MSNQYIYAYPRPSVTVDIIIKRQYKNNLQILLIQRKNEPFKNQWALPGGFVDKNEPLLKAAIRELKEETNIELSELKQEYAFGDPGRDPRGHTISIIYSAIVDSNICFKAADDAKNAKWYNIEKLPDLAFDHLKIINFLLKK